jgi:hypothetical protein
MCIQSDYVNSHMHMNVLYQYMCVLDMCYSLNVKTVLMCVYILCVCLFLYKQTVPVHVCAGLVRSLQSIMTVLMCVPIYES